MTKIAEALFAAGLSVWWDTAIEGGSAFAKDIARELDAADVVVVVWSATSVESAWVLDEAGAGRDRKRLVPVQIDSTLPPLGFRQLQSIDLSAWKGRTGDAKIAALVSAIQKLAGSAAVVTVAKAAPASSGPSRRLLIGGAAGVAALAAGGFGAWKFLGQKADDDTASVAVLPFANLSGDPAQAYFSDGIAEELRSALARIVRLKVAARPSSELMRDSDAKIAAAKLGVANIVTGSVRRGTRTIRVSAQLIDGSSGLTRWSESYDRSADDVLLIETGIAENVAGALNIILGRDERLLFTAGGTTNPAAQDAYLRGAAFWAKQKFDDALPAYSLAVAIDPGFALARTGLAIMMVSAAYAGNGDPGPAVAAAVIQARRAVALAPRLGAPLAALGFILMGSLDLRGAAAAHAAAYRLAPGDAYVVRNYAKFQAEIGRDDDAVRAAYRYAALDPVSPNSAGALAAILYRAGRLDDAITAYRRALAGLPGDIEALAELSLALLATGQTRAALKLTESMPLGSWQELTARAIALARLGDRAGSDRALERLRGFGTEFYQTAEVLAQRGEIDAAFAALDLAYALVDGGLSDLKSDPMMRPLHGDPRYAGLIRRIGFP